MYVCFGWFVNIMRTVESFPIKSGTDCSTRNGLEWWYELSSSFGLGESEIPILDVFPLSVVRNGYIIKLRWRPSDRIME